MKLSTMNLFLAITVFFVVTTKAQQSTLKTTGKIATTTLKTTTTRKPNQTTTRKLNATTTVKRNVTTTKPPTIPVFSFCRDTSSSAATGRIQLVKNTSTSACTFDIVAPFGQQIQISCSVFFFNSYTSTLTLYGATERIWPLQQPVENRTYYSVDNTLSLYSKFKNTDGFDCKWSTAPKENTTKFTLCRHGQASSANGTVQPMPANNSSDPSRHCVFSIKAPPEYQIIFSCSVVNLNDTNSIFQVDGTTAVFDSYNTIEINQTLYSSVENEVILTSTLGKGVWIDCKWTTERRENNKTNFKLCRDGEATAATGTITPSGIDQMPLKGCSFLITAPSDHRIEISCSASNLNASNSFLQVEGLTEYDGILVNKTYYSTSENIVLLSSKVSNSDWFSCKWLIRKENNTNAKFCSDLEARSPNGTLIMFRGVDGVTEPVSYCGFEIRAPPDQQIAISCSSISLNYISGESSSFFDIEGLTESVYYQNSFVVNRVYYSTPENEVTFFGQVDRANDWINCSWSIVPKTKTTHFELCRDITASSANGTITPLKLNPLDENWYQKLRSCTFTIYALPSQQIEFSCSVLNLYTDQMIINGITGRFRYGSDLVLNRKYYSNDNYLHLYIEVNNDDWFSCQWTAVPSGYRTSKSLTQLLP